MLQSPNPADRERILTIGPFGSGKTYGWLKIADWAQRTESTSRFFVLDTDAAVSRMLNSSGSFAHLENVKVTNVWEWKQYEQALDSALEAAQPGDWIIVDFIGSAWDAVQEWYVDQIYDTNIADFFLDARKSMKSGNPLDGWKDWAVINRVYRRWVTKMVENCPAHVYWTATAQPLRDTDDRSLKAIFGAHGVRPAGQKHLGHQVHTILYFQPAGRGDWLLSTVKDRERQALEGVKVSDFAVDYLVQVAGWEL